ncbi:MAG: alpha-2-macroglobulin [SAR202 cluster bacterium]|nr:alpha-2-macroglobulin [SAR202 cluster bacterium]
MLSRTRMLGLVTLLVMLVASMAACSRDKNPTPTPQSPTSTPAAGTVRTPTPAVPTATRVPIPVSNRPPDSYMAVVPAALRAGHTENISMSLFAGNTPAAGDVRVALIKDNITLVESKATITGAASVPLSVPKLAPGNYDLQVSGPGFSNKATLQIQDGTLMFVETDKPIYKPGQTIHIRVLTLDTELKPWPIDLTVEVQDAKGTKVFKKDIATDEYGMATLDLPLSTEPNLGVWKITARAGDKTSQLDVKVEEYVLPKYEVVAETQKEWVLASEQIKGKVSSTYTFGKPVKGEVEILASRYVGQWEQYATLSLPIDGEVDFTLPAVQFVAGVPEAEGMGNVSLECIVREMSTGYEEKTTKLLTVASTPLNVKIIPESGVFKPGLPLGFLAITETPDGQPLDKTVKVTYYFMGKNYDQINNKTVNVSTKGGKAIFEVTPPSGAVSMTVQAEADQASTSLSVNSGFSPSGNFIHLEQVTEGDIKVGDAVHFRVHSTSQARNFYYEIVSRGSVIYSDVSFTADIRFTAGPLMAPASRILVYQILANNEVAADYLPFSVQADYTHDLSVAFSKDQVTPGEKLDINVQAQGQAKVGLAIVDKSVFILAENRLNLQQVFAELERLYMKPQAELHDVRWGGYVTRGAKETFKDAGVVVLTNKTVPKGEQSQGGIFAAVAMADGAVRRDGMAQPMAAAAPQAPTSNSSAGVGLAEVQRVRQFFPETWIWMDTLTSVNGLSTVPVEAPDSITTWKLRAVGISKEHGFGVAESELRVFQPFFLQVDLPYSAIRGEEFPVKIALYNYLETQQEIFVDVESADWFELLDSPQKSAKVGPNDIGGVEFKIRPTKLGNNGIKVVARSSQAADAVIKELLIEPEGVQREAVENHIVSDGHSHEIDLAVPTIAVDGSGRAYVAITGSYLTQTIEGLESLLQMPYGCGEQNMILFAPNVFIANYLKQTGQLKPEVMAKAEHLMTTGYQRELTYRHSDGAFSAFGESDEEGSLWLTAFVLKTFAQAKNIMYIDQDVLSSAAAWIVSHQRSDGSFEPVGFLHHQELLGGLQGNDALTAYVAIALMEAGETSAANRAVRFLEGKVASIDDAYTMAIVSYALDLGNSARADEAHKKLMGMAKEDENGGLFWGEQIMPLEPQPLPGGPARPIDGGYLRPDRAASIETTGYAMLALVERGDRLTSGRVAKWLTSQRNAFGGFGSTQDTVVSLQALINYATDAKSDVDMTVTLTSGSWSKVVRVTAENADVLQMVQVPIGGKLSVKSSGKGDVVVQSVLRYNMPQAANPENKIFDIKVTYSSAGVQVDDLITVSASIRFTPPQPVQAGMVVLDVSVPTGFAPERDTIEALVASRANIKRYDIAGRKVIFYIEDMKPGETVALQFKSRALYPVRAKEVASQAYSYYKPEWKGESLGGAITVGQ